MELKMIQIFAFVALTSIAVAGCSGGGTSATRTAIPEPVASSQTPIYSNAANDNRLSESLPVATNVFAPLSSALFYRPDPGQNPGNVSITDEFSVKGISSDGADGFHVTYVLDGQERTVNLGANDWQDSDREFDKTDGDRRDFLWSRTDSFTRNATDRNSGSSEFSYFDVNGFATDLLDDNSNTLQQHRVYMAYGARTEALPVGSATYNGRAYADSRVRNTPENTRIRWEGDLELSADLDGGTIQGTIDALSYRGPDGSGSLPDDTITIHNGQIINGQFTAAMRGVGDELDGLTGKALGEFYGPAAEEVGGVIHGQAGDTIWHGWFGGKQ